MRADLYKNKKKYNNSAQSSMSAVEYIGIQLENSGVDIARVDMLRDSTCVACINVLAGYLASMSLHMYKDLELESVKMDIPLINILKRPNPYQTYFNFFKEMVIGMLVNGESFAAIITSNGAITALEVIENGTLSESIVGSNKWIVQGNIRSKHVNLDYDNVVHFKDLNDKFKALKDILTIKTIANSLIEKSFNSNLKPNLKGVIELSEESEVMPETAKINLKRSINKVLNSEDDGVMILDPDMTFTSLNNSGVQAHSFAESQVKEIIAIQDDKIHQVFNVPKFLTSIAEGSYNLSENQKSLFIESLLPLIKMIETELDIKLLTTKERLEGLYFKINYESLLRGNTKDRYDSYTKADWMTIAEKRKKEGLPFIEGTDELAMRLDTVPLSKYDDYINKKYLSESE